MTEKTLVEQLRASARYQRDMSSKRTATLQDAAADRIETLEAALEEAVGDILALAHARWSEVEATDDELVGDYRATLAS